MIKTLITMGLALRLKANNLLNGSTTTSDSSSQITDTNTFQDFLTDTTISTQPAYLVVWPAKKIRVYTVVVVMNPLYTTNFVGRLFLQIDTSKIQCGSLMDKDQIYSCGGLSGVFVVEHPYKVTEFWAYSWDIYDMSSLTGSVSSSTASAGKPATDALSMESMLWANSNNYFQSDGNTDTWWRVTFPTMVYIRRVVLFSNRSSNLLDLKVLVKIIEDTENDGNHMCGGKIGSFNFFVSFCEKTGNELIIRAPTRQFTLYYVGAIYQQASCALDSICQSVEGFSYQDDPLPLVMASPPTMTFSSVGYTNTCCPVAWYLDLTNEVTGTTILASQNMILAATAVNFHQASTKTLKFKLVYFDGTITKWSALLSRTVTITCMEAVVYKIDNLEQISVFTTSPGVITTKDYATCLGGGTVTVTCDQTIRSGYAVVSGNQITMDFTKRVSTQFVDENYFVKCTHTSTTGQYYTDEYRVDSIDCSKGLQTPPNPALTLDSQTVALNTFQKFIIPHNTLRTIAVSAFSIEQVPAAYGKQCGSLGYDIEAPSGSGITITKSNDTTFDLNTSGYTMQDLSDTVTMKLKISCPQFASPIEYSFNLEITTGCTATNLNTSITSYNIYYLISGEAQTVELPYVLSSSYCFPLTYAYYDASETQQSVPSWLTFGETGNKPTVQIQLSDKTKKGKHRIEMLVPSQTPISFYLYLAALVEPAIMYSSLQINSANETWLTDVESTNFSVVYKWSVDDSQPNVSTRFQIQSHAMSVDGTVITNDKNSPTTTSGLTWTTDPNGNYELGWKILADKTQPTSLQIGTFNMQLAISVTFTDIDGSGNPKNTIQTVSAFKLSLKNCSDASHFSQPAAPGSPDSVLYDQAMNAVNANSVHTVNVKNPKHFYIGAFTSSPCDFVANCCPLTYSGQAYRSDNVLISSQNGGVEILMINQQRKIYDNQLNVKRLPLPSENFIQQITFKVTVSNGLITTKTLTFKLVNCEQNPPLTQPNINFVDIANKTVDLKWQNPSSALDASCIPHVSIYAMDDTTEHNEESFEPYLKSINVNATAFISIDENVPPKITLKPIHRDFKDLFARTWKMKIKTRNGDNTLVNGQEWSDEKIFYINMCYRPLEDNNGVIHGQRIDLKTTGIKQIQLKKSTTPIGSSVCTNLHIKYDLTQNQSWISLYVGPTDPIKNILSVETTGLAPLPLSETFKYNMFYYLNPADSSYISSSSYTITITVDECSANDIAVQDSWFKNVPKDEKILSARRAKENSITLKAFTQHQRDTDCGQTLYDQYIRVTDGTTVHEFPTECPSFTSCFGFMLDATFKELITINLKNMTTTGVELKVTIFTTFYNSRVPIAQGLKVEWSQLTVVDCTQITLIEPDPWIVSEIYQVGSSGTEIKSVVWNVERPIQVPSFSHQWICTKKSLETTNSVYQSIFKQVDWHNFTYNPINAGTVNNTLQINCSLKIEVPGNSSQDRSLAFQITLYNCSSPVETAQTYVYAAMLGSANPLDYEVIFPWSDSSISYLELCNKFEYEFMTMQTPTPAYVTTPPAWVTLINYNPITVVNGVNLKIKTSNQEHAGHQIIRKSLLVAENQAVTHTVHICIYEPPTPMFTNADSTLTLKVLNSLPENCINFNNWNVIKKSPTCSSCADATCGTASNSLSSYNFLINGQLLTTDYYVGLKIADDTTNNQKKLCWNLSQVSGNNFTMSYVIHVTTQSFIKEFTFQKIFCSNFTVVDPSPWIKQQPGDLTLSGGGFTIYFPSAVQPTFEVQPYSNNNFCDSSGTCCSTVIESSTVKTFYSTDLSTEQTGFMTSSADELTLLDSQVPGWLGSTLEKQLTVYVTLSAAQFSFERTFNIKFVNCSIASQPNLSYLVNRATMQSHTFNQAQNHCTGLIRIRKPDGEHISNYWFSSIESSTTQIKINNNQVPIDDSQLGDYDLQRYVETVTSPVQKFNIINFKLSLCKLTAPVNNGVDPSSITSFDIANPTGTLKLAYGSVSSGTNCSTIEYSISGLVSSWMTYQPATNQIIMTMPQSEQSMNIVYTLKYNDGVEPSYQVSFTINLKFVTCGFTVPSNWVSPQQNPTAFALIFEQDSEDAVVYAIQAVTMQSTEPACGTLTYSASATMTPIEDTTTFVSMSGLQLTVNLGARASNLATFTMNVKVKIDITRQSETKEFSINFFDCRVPTGTINPLPNLQFEVDETKSFTDQGYQGLDVRCAPFKILLAFETSPGNWFSVTTAGTPASFISYTSTAGPAPTLSFQVKPQISYQGAHSKCKLLLTNRGESAKIESTIFTSTVCKAQVSQAFISPSSTALTGNVFDFVRSLTIAQPKLQVQLSSAYFDSIQPLCTYTSLTIVNLDTSQVPMTVQTTSQTQTLVMDSFAWTSNGLVYSRELEVKLWHNTELVYFATAPHKFTVNIYDCEKDMVPPTKWIVQDPQFASSNDYLFQTGSGDHSLQITIPTRNYFDAICGPLVFEVSSTNPLAITNLILDSSTGLITVKTPANVHWGPEVINIKVKNSYAAITPNSFTFRVQVFDCQYESINIGSQPAVTEMVSTGPDWSYTWNAFTTSFPPCFIDTYEVACAEGAYNIGSNLCSRGFQYNKSPTSTATAALNSKTINPLTIYAQYHETQQISVDHEGEFTFTISGFNALTPTNKNSYSILVKIKTPCNDPLNLITAVTQTFVGNCRTTNGETFCDDVHYKIFTTQSNPIAPFTIRFPYSCSLTYQIKLKEASVEVDVPSFIRLNDSNGAATTTAPLWLDISSVVNSDKDYSDKTLVLRASVQQFTQVTEFKLFVYNDCRKERVQMLNTGQTFNASFTVGQDMITGQQPTYLTFGKVQAVQASDQKYCIVNNSDLSLEQLNKPSWLTTSYHPDLFQLIVDQANGNNRVHIKASKDADVISGVCNLSDLGTNSCKIDLEIIATGLNGTYPFVATGWVDFKSECHLSLQYWDQINSPSADKWVWDVQDSTNFKKYYQIHLPLVTLNLPKLTVLSLPSGKSFAEVCGAISYSLTTPIEPFTIVQPTSDNDKPKMQVFSKNPLHANKDDPVNFTRAYALDIKASNSKGSFQVTYATTQARQDAMTFSIQDLCYGVTYSTPKIYFNDGRNSPKETDILLVMQPILFDRYDVKMYYQTFEIQSGDSSKCGYLTYSGKQTGDPSVIKMGSMKDEKMNQIDGLYFNLYAGDNKYKGVYNVIFTASLSDSDKAYAHHYPTSDAIIEVHIEDCFVKSYSPSQPVPPKLVFILFGITQTVLFKDFMQVPACNYTQQFNITAYKVENGNKPEFKEGSQPQNSPFNLDSMQRRITFETKLISLANTTYEFFITGHLDNPQKLQKSQVNDWGPFSAQIVQSTFMVENTAPVIEGIESGYTVYKGETSTVTLGLVSDLENNKVSLISWSVTDFAKKWLKLSSTVNIGNLVNVSYDIDIPADTTEQQFNLYLTLADDHLRQPIIVDYITYFKIIDKTSENRFAGLIQTNKTLQEQFLQDLAPAGNPKQISMSGGFIFEFDKPIDMARLGNITSWNSTNVGQSYFEFTLVPGDQAFYRENEANYRYAWNITNTTSTTITFQFVFSDYDIISQQEIDKMRFKILVPELFVNERTKKPTTFSTSLQSIPKQVRDAQAQQQIQYVTDNLDRFLKALSASSFLQKKVFYVNQVPHILLSQRNSVIQRLAVFLSTIPMGHDQRALNYRIHGAIQSQDTYQRA